MCAELSAVRGLHPEGRPPVQRALVLAAGDGEDPADVVHLPLGRRDARLLDLLQRNGVKKVGLLAKPPQS